MAPPAWASCFAAALAAISFLGLYLGQAYPHLGFILLGVVGAGNAFLGAIGYANAQAVTNGSTSG